MVCQTNCLILPPGWWFRTQPQAIEEAKKELSERLAGRTYRSQIREGVEPPVDFNRETM